jgi:hypothetical protein
MRATAVVALLILVAGACIVVPSLAGAEVPAIEFAGSRPARPSDDLPISVFPDEGPLERAKVDSMLTVANDPGEYPTTRYAVFPVDLDADGESEEIVQLARISERRNYSRAWWGIYQGRRLARLLFWSAGEERARIAQIRRPESIRDAADSLAFVSSIPEFFPAVDVVTYGDLTGDGHAEIVVWMAGRAFAPGKVQGVLVPLILSPGPEGLREVFRVNLLHARVLGEKTVARGLPECTVSSYRLRTRYRSTTRSSDLLLEPWSPVPADSVCRAVLYDERMIPHDPDAWMPIRPLEPEEAVPDGWMVSRWEETGFGGLWFAGAARAPR